MNITSFKISKELYEAGFKAQSNTLVHDDKIFGEKFPGYDLETLLGAMPENYQLHNDWIQCFKNASFNAQRRKAGESLADLVARSLLHLIKTKQI
jgi:hypothetical protein